MAATESISTSQTTATRRRFIPQGTTLNDNITGWTFVLPAVFIIFVFGLFPILYAVYMSVHRWRIRKSDFLGTDNYTWVFGDWGGVFLFILGFIILFTAFTLWTHAFNVEIKRGNSPYLRGLIRIPAKYGTIFLGIAGIGMMLVNIFYGLFDYQDTSQAHTATALIAGVAMIGAAVILHYGSIFLWEHIVKPMDDPSSVIKIFGAILVMGIGLWLITQGWARMNGLGNEDFLEGLTITFWFAFSTVPAELGLGLVLAYVLFQNIKGKQWYRMVFFLPYVAPDVAMAVVFRVVFSPRETALANQFLGLFGIPAQEWVTEPEPLVNTLFGLNLDGFIAGPSMALFSIALLGIWKYTGYNAVIFLAGLGAIPRDLYEAGKVDGATEWHLFRHITIPLLSPVTFYLAILAFIGTFKSFNSIYVMRTAQAQGTVDVASIAIFDRFFASSQFGRATAEAILLFLIILALTQTFRNVFEKRVFYG